MCRFPVYSDGQRTISLRFYNSVQERDGTILFVVLYCKPYGRVNTVDVLQKPCLLASLWMTKVSSTYLPQNLGVGGVQYLELFVLSNPCISWLQWGWLGNPWQHPQPVHRTGLGKKSRFFETKLQKENNVLNIHNCPFLEGVVLDQ